MCVWLKALAFVHCTIPHSHLSAEHNESEEEKKQLQFAPRSKCSEATDWSPKKAFTDSEYGKRILLPLLLLLLLLNLILLNLVFACSPKSSRIVAQKFVCESRLELRRTRRRRRRRSEVSCQWISQSTNDHFIFICRLNVTHFAFMCTFSKFSLCSAVRFAQKWDVSLSVLCFLFCLFWLSFALFYVWFCSFLLFCSCGVCLFVDTFAFVSPFLFAF